MRGFLLKFGLLAWPFALGLVASFGGFISIGVVFLALPIFIVGIGLQLRHDETLGQDRIFFSQFALLFVGSIAFLTIREPFPYEKPRGNMPWYYVSTEYPGRLVMLAELVHYGPFDFKADVDPGAVIELPTSRCDPRTIGPKIDFQTNFTSITTQEFVASRAPHLGRLWIGPKPGSAFQEVVQTLCLDNLAPEHLSAFALYPSKHELHAILRTPGIETHRVFDLRILFPGFEARDLTAVPGETSQFAIWGAGERNTLRILRFELGPEPLTELTELLISDARHPVRAAPRSACVQAELVDQAWYVSSKSGALFHYCFSNDQVTRVKGESRGRDLLHADYLEVNWTWPGEIGLPFMIQGSRSPASRDLSPATPGSSMDIWMEADGSSVRSVQGGLFPR